MASFQLFFSVKGTGGSLTGPDPENRVGHHDTGNSFRRVSCGLQVPGESGHCCAKPRPPCDLPAGDFLQNVLKLHQQRRVILRVDNLTRLGRKK
jgi:hypothetical protein